MHLFGYPSIACMSVFNSAVTDAADSEAASKHSFNAAAGYPSGALLPPIGTAHVRCLLVRRVTAPKAAAIVAGKLGGSIFTLLGLDGSS